MKNLRSWFSIIVAAGYLLGSAFAVPAAQAQQGPHAHGAVVGLKDTPHLWIADEHGVLHWGGDTRALAGKHIAWSNRIEVCLPRLRTWPVGDPWLSAGLLKDGAPIYQVKWETEWAQPKLLHIQSIKDVELFGIDGSNYGNYVLEKSEWERRFGIPAAGLERSPLAPAVEPPAAMPFPRGSEALHNAIWRGQTNTVRTLVAAGAQLNVVDDGGDPLLHEAIWRGHTAIRRLCGCWSTLARTLTPETPVAIRCSTRRSGVAIRKLCGFSLTPVRNSRLGSAASDTVRVPMVVAQGSPPPWAQSG